MKKLFLAGLVLATALGGGSAFAQTPFGQTVQPAPAPAPAPGPAAVQTQNQGQVPTIDQGDVFLGVCQRPENLDACLMYYAGYANGVLVQSLLDKQRPRYCIPPNVSRKDQLAAVTTWMKRNLDHVLEPTAAVVYKALVGTFPCR
ncbi:Rap1a/Tai family immunity protein [Paraburkholderia sp. J76]|uniref:Rap1a/Tai family immunity protein n=1 Tax=Paraburkholderia sp. J76 TaxID=2805439 RepID=UPI002ABE3847|nr:Rap1a/Tai family immunity protein [Paraburkholderia sp. J76]